MHLLGRDTLNVLQKRNEMLDKWLAAWVCEFVHARWWCSADVLSQFPKVQERSDGLFLFQTEPKGYCIEVQIAFPQGIALITALTEIMEDNNG
jgi:mRNA-degrading endonuclease HigB of HigAB toxin-antitoxin module